jgi:hypothetical protein
MDNRFLTYSASLPVQPRARGQATSSLSRSYARSFTANQRALIVLIENGGIDLGIPELVEKLLLALPGSSLIGADTRRALVDAIRAKLKSVTDTLIESADLALNRFGAAVPGHYDSVTVLRDGTATYEEIKRKLIELSTAGKIIDLLVLTHGGRDHISAGSGINGAKIKEMRTAYGKALNLRSVYMMNCIGSSLNEAWIAAGAKVSVGSIANNYLPEPTAHFFWENWKAGQNFETSNTNAYRRTVSLMNDTVKGFIRALPIPGSGELAEQVNFEKMQFVIDSAPVIQGQRSIQISSDDLVFGQSLASSLCTTVVPVDTLKNLAQVAPGLAQSASYHFESPSAVMSDPRFARQQNPAAVVIAGIEVADAIQIGLGAAAMVQAQVSASAGSFSLSYDRAQRMLTNEARQGMPGAQQTKRSYAARLMYVGIGMPGFAKADITIEWEGNPYGEIGTAVIKRDLDASTDWSKSSFNCTINKLERIPFPGTDPRSWPLVFSYDGTYDPAGNGHFEFNGEFEINAFGGLKFNKHKVVSRALLEFAIIGKPEEYVIKGQDIPVATPTIPDEQVKYLKSKLP